MKGTTLVTNPKALFEDGPCPGSDCCWRRVSAASWNRQSGLCPPPYGRVELKRSKFLMDWRTKEWNFVTSNASMPLGRMNCPMGRNHAEPSSAYGANLKIWSYTKMHRVKTRKKSKRLTVYKTAFINARLQMVDEHLSGITAVTAQIAFTCRMSENSHQWVPLTRWPMLRFRT